VSDTSLPMIQITYREFQRGFCKLRNLKEVIEIVGKGGVVIGHYVSAVSDRQPSTVSDTTANEVLYGKKRFKATEFGLAVINKDGTHTLIDAATKSHGVRQLAANNDNEVKVDQNSDGVRQQAIKCTKCPKKDATHSGTVWYEGEEMKVNACQTCYNSQPSKKSFIIITN